MWSRRFRLLAGPNGPVCSGLRPRQSERAGAKTDSGTRAHRLRPVRATPQYSQRPQARDRTSALRSLSMSGIARVGSELICAAAFATRTRCSGYSHLSHSCSSSGVIALARLFSTSRATRSARRREGRRLIISAGDGSAARGSRTSAPPSKPLWPEAFSFRKPSSGILGTGVRSCGFERRARPGCSE